MARVKALVLGAVVFLVAHAILVLKWQAWFGDGPFAAWFMNSGPAVAFAAALLAAAGALVGAREATFQSAAVTASLVAGGAVVAMIVVLFTAIGGAGTLAPLAIVIGAMVLESSCVAGAGVGYAVRRGAQRRG